MFPSIRGEVFELGHQGVDQFSAACVIGHQLLHARESEHLALGVVGFRQTVALEKDRIPGCELNLIFLVAHIGHEPERHSGGLEFYHSAIRSLEGQAMTCISEPQGPRLWVED